MTDFTVLIATPEQASLDPNASYWQSGAAHLSGMLERMKAAPESKSLAYGVAGLLGSREQIIRVARATGSASEEQLAVLQAQLDEGREILRKADGWREAAEEERGK